MGLSTLTFLQQLVPGASRNTGKRSRYGGNGLQSGDEHSICGLPAHAIAFQSPPHSHSAFEILGYRHGYLVSLPMVVTKKITDSVGV